MMRWNDRAPAAAAVGLCSVGAPASAMVPCTHHAMANAMRIAQRQALLAARPDALPLRACPATGVTHHAIATPCAEKKAGRGTGHWLRHRSAVR